MYICVCVMLVDLQYIKTAVISRSQGTLFIFFTVINPTFHVRLKIGSQ